MGMGMGIALGACGKASAPPRDEPRPAAAAKPTPAAADDYAGLAAPQPVPTDAPALRAALPAVRAVLERDPRPPPATFDAEIAVLVAWDRPGATYAVPCLEPNELGDFPALNTIAEDAIELSDRGDDPRVHAALALATALRRPDQDPAAIEIGMEIAGHAAGWFALHQLAPSAVFDDLAPERDVIVRFARAQARCAMQIAARDLAIPAHLPIIARKREELGLDVAKDLVHDELSALRLFCEESVARVIAAKDGPELEGAATDRKRASVQAATAAVVSSYGCDLMGMHDLVLERDGYPESLARARRHFTR
jgi:hypothetical protein